MGVIGVAVGGGLSVTVSELLPRSPSWMLPAGSTVTWIDVSRSTLNDCVCTTKVEPARRVDEPMICRDAPRPPSGEIASERLGFPDPLKRGSHDVAQE